MSSHLSQSAKKRVSHMSVLFCPLSTVFSVYLLQNKGVLTCVRTWLSPSQLSCLPAFRKVRKGWF